VVEEDSISDELDNDVEQIPVPGEKLEDDEWWQGNWWCSINMLKSLVLQPPKTVNLWGFLAQKKVESSNNSNQ
jgi:hypothetical protein